MADALDDLENLATNKIAGIPAWGWAAGIAAAIGGYLWWRNKQNENAPTHAVVFTAQPTADGLNMDVPTTSHTAGGTGGGGGGGGSGVSIEQITGAVNDAVNNLAEAQQKYATQQQRSIDNLTEQVIVANTANTSQNDGGNSQVEPAEPIGKQATVKNARQLAQQLNKSVHTAYGYVSPTGTVTSTDLTYETKSNAKQLAQDLGRPVHTAYGYITSHGAAYETMEEAKAHDNG